MHLKVHPIDFQRTPLALGELSSLPMALGSELVSGRLSPLHRHTIPSRCKWAFSARFSSWPLTFRSRHWQIEQPRVWKLLVLVMLGAGGAATQCPAACPFQRLFFLTALPLKKGNSWAWPIREEEGPLSLNPGDVCGLSGLAQSLCLRVGAELLMGKEIVLMALILLIFFKNRYKRRK